MHRVTRGVGPAGLSVIALAALVTAGGCNNTRDRDELVLPAANGPAKNIIFVMGDGMGPEQVFAGRVFKNGPDVPLTFETLSEPVFYGTDSLDGLPTDDPTLGLFDTGATDSAAAATAIATGRRVENGNVGALPNEEDLFTILELAQTLGKSTGIITTSYIQDASPSAFVARNTSRGNQADIIKDILLTQPTVVFGAGRLGVGETEGLPGLLLEFVGQDPRTVGWDELGAVECARFLGYETVDNAAEFEELVSDPFLQGDRLAPPFRVMGIFDGDTQISSSRGINDAVLLTANDPMSFVYDRVLNDPNTEPFEPNPGANTDPMLDDLVAYALDVLSANPNGFFLFVENEGIDALGHAQALFVGTSVLTPYLVREVALLDDTVDVIESWRDDPARAGTPDDTLVMVTADHECCGLQVLDKDNPLDWSVDCPNDPDGCGYEQGDDQLFARSTNFIFHTRREVAVYATGPGSERVTEENVQHSTDLFRVMLHAMTGTDSLVFPPGFFDIDRPIPEGPTPCSDVQEPPIEEEEEEA